MSNAKKALGGKGRVNARRQAVYSLRARGLTYREIAKEVSVNPQVAARWCRTPEGRQAIADCAARMEKEFVRMLALRAWGVLP